MKLIDEIKSMMCKNCQNPATGKVEYTTGVITHRIVKGKIKREAYTEEICGEKYFCKDCEEK